MTNKFSKERRHSINATPTIQQEEPVARSPGGPQTKTGQGARQSTENCIVKLIVFL
jgi:hypothetical protein